MKDKKKYLKLEYITGFILISIYLLYYLLYEKSIDAKVANIFLLIVSLIFNILLLNESKNDEKTISNTKIMLISIWMFLMLIIPGIFGFLYISNSKEKKKLNLPVINEEPSKTATYIKAIISILIFMVLIFVLPNFIETKLTNSLLIYLTIVVVIILNYFKELKSNFKIFIKNLKLYFPFILKRYFIMMGLMLLVAIPIYLLNNGQQPTNQQELNELFKVTPIVSLLLTTLYAPFAEEAIFRLCTGKLVKNKYLFIIISGFLFGFLHVLGKFNNINEFLYIFQYAVFGICLAKAYYDSKNIYVSMSIHFIQNFVASVLSILLLRWFMKKKIIIISGMLFAIDQIIKYLVINNTTKKTIIPGFLKLFYVENNGVAFSMLSGSKYLIIIVSLVLLLFLFYELKKENNIDKLTVVTYGILFGGILGNLFDRIYRGYVIDYISFTFGDYSFAIFNFADIMITVGVFLLILKSFKKK